VYRGRKLDASSFCDINPRHAFIVKRDMFIVEIIRDCGCFGAFERPGFLTRVGTCVRVVMPCAKLF
jgi:hypothetical protein